MAGYLDEYGVKDAHRARIVKWVLISIPIVLIVGILGYFQFRNYSEEKQVRNFLQLLRDKEYKAAYALWGCTDTTPCRDYNFERFLEDWGPASAHANVSGAKVVQTKSCQGGIIETVRFDSKPVVRLWVESKSDNIGFAPWELKQVPPGAVNRFREWMWEVMRDCKPLIGP